MMNAGGSPANFLDEAAKAKVTDAASARALMLEQRSVIKRPVVEWADGDVTVGFDSEDWARRR